MSGPAEGPARPEAPGGPRDGEAGRGREAILARVREAVEGHEAVEHPGALSLPAPEDGVVEAFVLRFRAAGGEVVKLAGPDEAGVWLDGFTAGFGRMATGSDLPDSLRPDLPEAPPAEAELGVSMARWAAADTGSLLLDPREGRHVQLLPPVHLVWVKREALVATLAEALERARAVGLPTALALHSGPSKSADIGQILVTGIHGPGRVVAAVLGDVPTGTDTADR